jgi:hypothetical protein
VYSVSDTRYVNQFGASSSSPDRYSVKPFGKRPRDTSHESLPTCLRDMWAIRLTSGGDDEMLYAPGGEFWSFWKLCPDRR